MGTAYLAVSLATIAANTFSGVAAMTRFEPVMRTLRPALATAGIPQSWLVFPIGFFKAAGAAGLALGLAGVPLIGTAAAIGLILYFVCRLHACPRERLLAAVLPGGVRLPPAGRRDAGAGPDRLASRFRRSAVVSVEQG